MTENTQQTAAYKRAEKAKLHEIDSATNLISTECIRCGQCSSECDFLRRVGLPGNLATTYCSEGGTGLSEAFSCSLCRLCTVKCPKSLPISSMFLELRRSAVVQGKYSFRYHLPLKFYEFLGGSHFLRMRFLPPKCNTVFFPGCALPGIRPEQTLNVYRQLQRKIPQLGIVLDCCNKPSHDLGNQQKFMKNFIRKIKILQTAKVRSIVTVCPSCFDLFQQYGEDLKVSMIYEHLQGDLHSSNTLKSVFKCTIHDPCTMRFESEVQEQVRELVKGSGADIHEMTHSCEKTYCCGEGGAVEGFPADTWSDWKQKRLEEAQELPIITYCGGCMEKLKPAKTIHALDLLFGGRQAQSNNKTSWYSSLKRYLNRYQLKRKIKTFR